jgi:hypothetical protein
MYYFTGKPRLDVIGEVSLQSIGLAATDFLAAHGRGDHSGAAAERLGARLTGWTRDERMAWSRWAPLLLSMEGVERWTAAERRAAVAAVRAKGGRRESDFVRLFDAHRRLRAAVLALGEAPRGL